MEGKLTTKTNLKEHNMKLAKYKIVVLVLCISGIVQAQNTNKISSINVNDKVPASLKQVANNLAPNYLLSAVTGGANIKQVGNFNTAYIMQFSGITSSNFASIVQNSDNNFAGITQTGNGNSNTITQNGDGNQATVNVDGNNNTSNVVQDGNNNSLLQNITVDNGNYAITQQGNYNVLLKYDNAQSPKALIISQKGNGMRLIITGNSLLK